MSRFRRGKSSCSCSPGSAASWISSGVSGHPLPFGAGRSKGACLLSRRWWWTTPAPGPLLLAHVATREDVARQITQSGAGLVEEVRKVGSDLGERLDKQERRSDERMRVVRDSFDGFGREIGGIKERLAGMGNGRHYGEQQE